jgi:hypothetical protein
LIVIAACKEYKLKKYSSAGSIIESVKKKYQRIKVSYFIIE